MNRRSYLRACAGAGATGGLVALSGCLGAVGSSVARTESVPAILQFGGGDCDDTDVCVRPHFVRSLEEVIDSGNPALGDLRVRGWLGGSQLVAANYNNTRSNRSGVRSNDGDADSDGDGVDDGTERANYNNVRSNKAGVAVDEGDGSDRTIDLERAFEYLDPGDEGDGVVVGEVFVVSAPVVDLPGVEDPSATTDAVEWAENMVSGARRGSPTGDETVLRGLTAPTQVRRCCDKASPILYLSSPGDTDSVEFEDSWSEPHRRGGTGAPAQNEPVAGRAVATLDGGVKLPVLVWTQHLIHEGDHLFVAGWVVDDARLYENAATVLTASGRTEVRTYTSQMGQVHASRNADGEESCPKSRCTPTRAAALDAAMDARRSDGSGTDHAWGGLLTVSMDAPLFHDRRIIREVGGKK
ncbi:hypothetical protein [Haloglomus litoreum]|uniref:hypothetical protein n=1 Tax=Haloglomus litoreum TaxID=3034026 RepID=UPI0023E8D0C9|nr:hypothetical protein [Haloglomus sp. DT116]